MNPATAATATQLEGDRREQKAPSEGSDRRRKPLGQSHAPRDDGARHAVGTWGAG